jgi:hypothetical protein
MKPCPILLAGALLLSFLHADAAILTLRASATHTVPIFLGDRWTTNAVRDSRILQLDAGQVARVRHFHCVSAFTNDYQLPSTTIGLKVVHDDLALMYTHQTLYGGVQAVSRQRDDAARTPSHLPGVAAAGALPELVGPATLQLVFRGPVDGWNGPIFGVPEARSGAICTIEVDGDAHLSDPTNALQVDEDSVVILENQGPVEVVLESSVDLKQTWEKALPGIYGAISQKRFFRLKAVRP